MLNKTVCWIKERSVKDIAFMLVCILILMFCSYEYTSLSNNGMIIVSPFIVIGIYTTLIYGIGERLNGKANFKEILTLQIFIKVLEIIIGMSFLSLISILTENILILIIINTIIQIGLLIFNIVLIGRLENVNIKRAIQISVVVIIISLVVIGNRSYELWLTNDIISSIKQLIRDENSLSSKVDESSNQKEQKENISNKNITLISENTKVVVPWDDKFEKLYVDETYAGAMREDSKYDVELKIANEYTIEPYIEENIKSDYEFKIKDKRYKDVYMSKPTKLAMKNGMEYTNINVKYNFIAFGQIAYDTEYFITQISPNKVYAVKVERQDNPVDQKDIQQFLDITISK